MRSEQSAGPEASRARVGFIGLGSQGGPIVRKIVESGFHLTLWARRPESLEPFSHIAMTVADTPAALGAASDIVGICVVGDADVEDVLLRSDGVLAGMSAGGTVVIHSTIHPDTCRTVAAIAGERGIAVIDAPVSGGASAVEHHSLLVMVGGEPSAFEVCRPVLETFGNPVVHLGPLGSGQIVKLINNLVFTAQITMALEMFSLAEGLGIDPVAAGSVLGYGSGASRAIAILADRGVDLTVMRSHASILRKDVDLVAEYAQQRGADRPVALLDAALQALALLEL